MNIEIPALASKTAKAWGNDLLKDGSTLIWYRDAKGKGVEGVSLLASGQPPPWTGTSVDFFGKDLCAPPYFDNVAKKTTASGLIAVKGNSVKIDAAKTGCQVEPTGNQGIPGIFYLKIADVDGC